MLRKEWMGLAFVLVLGFQAPLFAQALSVVHAETPQYTQVAAIARLAGTVRVAVRIDPAGDVTSSAIEKGLPMGLDKSALEAAWHWKFNPIARGEAREALLTFLFELGGSTEKPGHTEASFAGPLTLRVVYVYSTMLWLPREEGEIPRKYCPIHGEAMEVEQVEVRWPTTDCRFGNASEWNAYEDAFAEAQKTLFPETHWSYQIGSGWMPGMTRAEIYYCQSCRDAEKAWRESHPEPVSSGDTGAAEEKDTASSQDAPPQG